MCWKRSMVRTTSTNGTANSDQLRTALEKIGKSATGGKADIRQLTDALDTVDDGQAIQNLIQQLREAGDAAENTADDVGQIAENTKGAALMQAADQLSAVGDKIQEIGDKALDALPARPERPAVIMVSERMGRSPFAWRRRIVLGVLPAAPTTRGRSLSSAPAT